MQIAFLLNLIGSTVDLLMKFFFVKLMKVIMLLIALSVQVKR